MTSRGLAVEARRSDATVGGAQRLTPRVALNRSVAVCLTAWVCLPQLNYFLPTWMGVSLALVWLFTSGPFLSPARWSADMASAVVFMFVLAPFALVGSFNYGTPSALPVLATFFLFLVGMSMSTYFLGGRGDVGFGRYLFWVATAAYVVGSVQTLVGLNAHPDASRLMAAARVSTVQFEAEGIGGFGFIYGAALMSVVLAGVALSRTCGRMPRLFSGAAFLLIMGTLTLASYTIGLIGAILGVALVVVGRRPGVVVGLLAGMTALVVLLHAEIGTAILSMLHWSGVTPVVGEKLGDLAHALASSDVSGQTGVRIDLYADSWNAFLANPVFGVDGSPWQTQAVSIGGHSGWLDLLARYGLLAAVPLLLSILLFFRKAQALYGNEHSRSVLLVVGVIFMCFGLVNPILSIYQMGFTLFLIVPLGIGIADQGRESSPAEGAAR